MRVPLAGEGSSWCWTMSGSTGTRSLWTSGWHSRLLVTSGLGHHRGGWHGLPGTEEWPWGEAMDLVWPFSPYPHGSKYLPLAPPPARGWPVPLRCPFHDLSEGRTFLSPFGGGASCVATRATARAGWEHDVSSRVLLGLEASSCPEIHS